MRKLDKLYKKLDQYSDFNETDNDEIFLNIVDKIIIFKNPNSLKVLLKYFNDEESSWVLEILKGMIKSSSYLSDQNFVKEIISNLYILFPHAKEWARSFLYIIFNEANCYQILRENIHLADPKLLNELLDLMWEESEHHRPQIEELRKLVNDLDATNS